MTEKVRLGTYVANAGVWDPISLASEAVTIDVVSGGRLLLGVGAGHTPSEWTMRGLAYPDANARVRRLMELVEATQRLLNLEEVTLRGAHFTLEGARLEEPVPVQRPIPLLIGGNGPQLLQYAAARADVVAITGLGRKLPDGHRHQVLWSPAEIDRRIERIRRAARTAGRTPELEALVQLVELTNDREATGRRLSERVPGLSLDDALTAPYIWIGTADEIAQQLRSHNERWGITRYVVRGAHVAAAQQVLNVI